MNGFLRRAKSGYNCSVKTHPPPRSKSQPSRHTQEQVEYVQLLVFQMNSHRIDLQLEEQNNNIYLQKASAIPILANSYSNRSKLFLIHIQLFCH